MANRNLAWLKMGMSIWMHGAKFTVINCINPRNTLLESEAGIRSSHNIVALFSSGYVKLSDAQRDDSHHIANLSVSAEELERANKIARDLDQLVQIHGEKGFAMEKFAKKYDVSTRQVHRWKSNYLEKGVPGLLRRFDKRGGKGKKRLDQKAEVMIQEGIKEHYLVRTPKSMDETIILIRSRFAAYGLEAPSVGAIRDRIKSLSEKDVLRAQEGADVAQDVLHVSQGEHKVDRPLQEVQIDHSPLDIELVSSKTRKGIGRPWITLIEDVHTRVFLGMYIGLIPPSFLTVALAIREAVFSKEAAIALYDLNDSAWPVYGLMEILHSDNAAEFDGIQMDHFIEKNRLEKRFRPVPLKEYGGHVESGIKVIQNYVHTLPGTTFSNPKERGDYDSEKRATLDLDALRRRIYRWVAQRYHKKERDELGGLSPLQCWQKAIDEGWQPRMPKSYDDFFLSLLPYKDRKITRHGISIDGLKYSGPSLRHWRAKEKPREGKRYRVYYDPLDMRWAKFIHPDGSGISKIPLISLSSEHPITLEEIRAAKKRSRRYPTPSPDLYLAHQQEKEELAEQAQKNKKARKALERRDDLKSGAPSSSSEKGDGFDSGIDYSRLPDWAKQGDS